MKFSVKRFKIVFFIIIYFLITQFTYFYYHNSLHGITSDIKEVFKPILTITIIEAYRVLNINNVIKTKDLKLIYQHNLFLFPISIILPKLLHIGTYVYSNGSGYKAFFNANNDLNIVLLVLLSFSIDNLIRNLNRLPKLFYNIFILLLLLVTLILIGSKSSFIFSFLIIIIHLSRSAIKNSFLKNLKFVFINAIVLGSLFYLLSNFFQNDINLILERQIYFYNSHVEEGDNLIAFLLSGRNEFLLTSYNAFILSDLAPFKFLFGEGKFYHAILSGGKIIEMDLFDIFFSFGLIGSLIIYGYFIKILLSLLKSKKKSVFPAVISYVTIAIFSLLGGHVMFSALSGSFLALTCSYLISENETTSNKELKNVIPSN